MINLKKIAEKVIVENGLRIIIINNETYKKLNHNDIKMLLIAAGFNYKRSVTWISNPVNFTVIISQREIL